MKRPHNNDHRCCVLCATRTLLVYWSHGSLRFSRRSSVTNRENIFSVLCTRSGVMFVWPVVTWSEHLRAVLKMRKWKYFQRTIRRYEIRRHFLWDPIGNFLRSLRYLSRVQFSYGKLLQRHQQVIERSVNAFEFHFHSIQHHLRWIYNVGIYISCFTIDFSPPPPPSSVTLSLSPNNDQLFRWLSCSCCCCSLPPEAKLHRNCILHMGIFRR